LWESCAKKDGGVIASDHQESDDYLKRLDVKKIYDSDFVRLTDAEVIAAGTGTSAHIKRIMELIKEKAYAPHFLVPRLSLGPLRG